MNYLFGDSSESDLDFNFLALLREVIDCVVVMAENEGSLAATVERRRARELEAGSQVSAVDDFGTRVSQVVGPVLHDQTGTPVGRCAAAIAASIKQAVDRESAQLRAALAAEKDEMDSEDKRLRARTVGVIEKLLRTHDLPRAVSELEVSWSGTNVTAKMRQRTNFGVEALLSLEVPANSVLSGDLRVDRIAENVEVHALEAGGWLRKSDKLVPVKLGRYQVTQVTVGANVTVQLRSTADPSAPGFDLERRGTGEITVHPSAAGAGRDFTIDERDLSTLRLLVERLEAAVVALKEHRAGLFSVEMDGKPIADLANPRVLAERMIAAIAPTVHQIALHSRSPGELVLRRPLGNNRREEIFVPTSELLGRIEGLPAKARELFAPLNLGESPPRPAAAAATASPPTTAPAPAAPEPRSGTGTSPPPMADRKPADVITSAGAPARTGASSIAPPAPGPDARAMPSRTSPPQDKSRPVVPAPAPARAATPTGGVPLAGKAAEANGSRLPAAVIVDKDLEGGAEDEGTSSSK